ncbi:hypothetical protein MKW94_002022 [Papaver nudicaule]|uniref:Storage protein n=1 Tax=Papaver nudicaule TaxID=74823 RepID=A0AA41SN34_PAPNU|nr:hypothetical protein [Papaver nudicaule]MCL7042471.1 hypothetical protein [Papaver nudicaule]
MGKKGNNGRSIARGPNETMRIIVTLITGTVFGFFVGVSFIMLAMSKQFPSSFATQALIQDAWSSVMGLNTSITNQFQLNGTTKIWATTNPRGAERLPPGIVASESDLYLRKLVGKPSEDLTIRPKYLVTFTVGIKQKTNIDAAVKKFSENFTILLFHYDGRTTEWDEFEWSKRAIHVSAQKQTKWWYAKRFLHPDIVAQYDYIFIWDEDLGVENFNAEEYIRLVKKHGLEISQPALQQNGKIIWQMTRRRDDQEVHKETEEKAGYCTEPHVPPCAAFLEIMAPVYSRNAWRCVWYMIQNDLVHGWGLDFSMRRCVEPAHEKMGVVDAQWVVHQSVPSLGDQGEAQNGTTAWRAVRLRCRQEWTTFHNRLKSAEKRYYNNLGMDLPVSKSRYYG